MSSATTAQILADDVRGFRTIPQFPPVRGDLAVPGATWHRWITAVFRHPRKDKVFFDLLERMAEWTEVSAEQLQRLSKDYPGMEAARLLGRTRLESSRLVRDAFVQLRGAFLPPFDPQDIHRLARELNAIVDTVASMADTIPLYHLSAMEPLFRKQVDVLVDATAVVRDVVSQLRKTRTLSEIRDKLIKIHHHESTGDDNHHAAISRLFDGTRDPLDVLRWKELYEHIEAAIDGCEDVSNTLTRLVLKGR